VYVLAGSEIRICYELPLCVRTRVYETLPV